MGSYDVTCNISHLPIQGGDAVRVVFLQRNQTSMDPANDMALDHGDNSRERCYATDFWFPKNIPIKAKYYDYGQVDHVEEGIVYDLFMEQLNSTLIEIPQGPNQYHDPAATKGMDWDRLWDVTTEGRLRVKGWHRKAVPVCAVMIREDVFQAMLALNPVQIHVKIDESIEEYRANNYHYVSPDVAYCFEEIRVVFNKLLAKPEDRYFDMEFTDWEVERLWLDGSARAGKDSLCFYFQTIVKKARAEGWTFEHPEVQKVLKGLAEMKVINDLYSDLRKTWHPGTGQGSQSVEYEFTARYHHAMAVIGYRAENNWNERCDNYRQMDGEEPTLVKANRLDEAAFLATLEPTLPSNKD